MNAWQKNGLYAAAQSGLIVLFGALFFFAPGRILFESAGWRVAGTVLAVIGLVLMAAAFAPLREVIQVAPEPKEGGHLVTSGIYSRLRHPIYSGIVLLVIGLFLRHAGVHVAVAAVLVIALLATKSRYEEKLLRRRYPEYTEYRKRTIGVIPGL